MKKRFLPIILCLLVAISGSLSAFATETDFIAAVKKIKDMRISGQSAISIAHRLDPVTGEMVLDRNTMLPETTLTTLTTQLKTIIATASQASPKNLKEANDYLIYLQNTALVHYDNFSQIETLYTEAITATKASDIQLPFDPSAFSVTVDGNGQYVVDIKDEETPQSGSSLTFIAPDEASITDIGDFKITTPDVTYSDVAESDWFYTQVMEMSKIGLFKGKGNNLFCPNDTMTGAEFLTVVMRILFPDNDLSSNPGEAWWRGAFNFARVNQVLTDEFSVAEAEDPLQRQKMASIVVNALKKRNESLTEYNKYWIPDYSIIFDEYCSDVCKAYGAGIIAGDDKYLFNPQKTLTRAEASTVIYRMINPAARANTDDIPLETKQQFVPNTPYPITIYEGQKRYNRPAREGDTFVKADGTRIILKNDQYGILGGGQGLAPDVGLSLGFDICQPNQKFSYDAAEFGAQKDSTGNNINNDTYFVNRTTGEAHWGYEWQHLANSIPAPKHKGKDGEVSTDAYALYRWSEAAGFWTWNK